MGRARIPERLSEMKNIGVTMESWLKAVGIATPADLEAAGALEAYRRVKQDRPRQVSLLALYALQGALLNLHWNALPPDLKEELRQAARSSS